MRVGVQLTHARSLLYRREGRSSKTSVSAPRAIRQGSLGPRRGQMRTDTPRATWQASVLSGCRQGPTRGSFKHNRQAPAPREPYGRQAQVLGGDRQGTTQSSVVIVRQASVSVVTLSVLHVQRKRDISRDFYKGAAERN